MNRYIPRIIGLTVTLAIMAGCAAQTRHPAAGCIAPVRHLTTTLLRSAQHHDTLPAAHRGGKDFGIDNALSTLRAAIRTGVPIIETDVRQLRTGELVLYHDRRLHPAAAIYPASLNGRAISSLSLTEWQMVQLPQTQEKPAYFVDALEAVRGFYSALLLDIKGTSPQLLDTIVREASLRGVSDRIIITCQSPLCLKQLRTNHPTVAILARLSEPTQFQEIASFRPELVQIDREELSTQWIREVHQSGSRILIKSVAPAPDERKTWDELIAQDVDVVLTAYPRRFLAGQRCQGN